MSPLIVLFALLAVAHIVFNVRVSRNVWTSDYYEIQTFTAGYSRKLISVSIYAGYYGPTSIAGSAPAGTVTRTASESFGAMSDKAPDAQIEVRASWTPETPDLSAHIEAWTEMLCTAAGLPPLPAGVVAMPTGRNRRR